MKISYLLVISYNLVITHKPYNNYNVYLSVIITILIILKIFYDWIPVVFPFIKIKKLVNYYILHILDWKAD